MFELDKTLEKDSLFICDLKLCKLLLSNNKFYPWLILVPQRLGMTEIFELKDEDRAQLIYEVNQISKLSKKIFKADKINIAAFGNIVSQLHIHIISRYKNDRVFPNPVWLDKEKDPYSEVEAQRVTDLIKSHLK